ncbi:MAG: flavin reductase [Thermoleophilia bacterium]
MSETATSRTGPPRRGDAPAVEPAVLRRTMGHFATGVAVVTARHPDGRPFGTTANSVTSVSLDPPLLLVCLTRTSETLDAIRASGRFAVNLLRAGQRSHSDRFARAAADDTWDGVDHSMARGAPVLHDGLGALVCDIHELADGGDHVIVIGRVLEAGHAHEAGDPLIFYRGSYGALEQGERPVPPPRPPRGPSRRPEVSLPSDLGPLRIVPLSDDQESQVSVAVLVGEPRGRPSTSLYLHRGCTLGDALGGARCESRRRLHEAVRRMRAGGGVVVYHRDAATIDACCLDRAAQRPGLGESEISAVRAAVRVLALGRLRFLGAPDDAARLAEEGVPVVGAWATRPEDAAERSAAA